MKKGTFLRSAKVLLHLIDIKIMPTKSETNVSWVKVCLIYAFLTQMEFDLGKVVMEHLARVRNLGLAYCFTEYDHSAAEDTSRG